MELLPGIELVNGDCAAVLPGLPPADLILTSPPYDGMREYGGYNGAFDFDRVATACVDALAPGGVLVWVVADQIVDGGDSGASFRQSLRFMALGLTLHQPMIYQRWSLSGMRKNAYYKDFEYTFVFSLGKPKTANVLEDRRNLATGGRKASKMSGLGRTGDQKNQYVGLTGGIVPKYGRRGSVWYYNAGKYAGNLKGDLDLSNPCRTSRDFPATACP